MSKTCGDTARFHRIRKQRINMRMRIRALRAEIETSNAAKKAAAPAVKPAA